MVEVKATNQNRDPTESFWVEKGTLSEALKSIRDEIKKRGWEDDNDFYWIPFTIFVLPEGESKERY